MGNITQRERFARRFGEAVLTRRHALGMTLRDLEYACGIDQGNLSKVERGDIVPRLDSAVRIATGLKTSVADLLAA